MSIRGTVLSLAAATFVASALMLQPASAATDDTVAATINGDKIYKKDVLSAMKNLPVKSDEQAKVYPMVVNQMINEKIIDKATAQAKIQDSAEYKQRLVVLQNQLVKQMYIENFLKDKITDSKVKAEYDKLKADNNGKQEIHARHIIVQSEDEAKQVIKDLDAGAKFEDLAKKRSSGPTAQNGGDLGWFAKDDMIPEFSGPAFALKSGTYTKEPVHTQFGWHVIKVEDRRNRVVPDLKEVDQAIRNKLSQEALAKMVMDLRAKADIKQYDINGKEITEPAKN